LSVAQVNARWPQFALSDDLQALYQPDYGVLFASRCVATAWRYAASLGAEVHTGWRSSSFGGVGGGSGVEGGVGGAVRVTSESGEAIEAKVSSG